MTDGNADANGVHRIQDLKNACNRLGVDDLEVLGFPDKFEHRLNVDLLKNKLMSFQVSENDVYTHGVLGEYGHPHHQDVSLATHRAFFNKKPVFSVAYNCFADIQVSLSHDMWLLKSEIYSNCYFSETQRFIQMLPITFTEGFSKVSLDEVEAIYDFLSGKRALNKKALSCYSSIEPYFEYIAGNTSRPF